MMRTDELTSKEMYRLVMEAYAEFYLGSGWLFRRIKEYLNPFGKFNWMIPSLTKLIKQGILGGLGMLYSQGITSNVISDELKDEENLMVNINAEYQNLAHIYSKETPPVDVNISKRKILKVSQIET
ncbi:MAG: hypothetical protein ACFFD1_16015, partial [Candidatus Thorarchaeota archaeon]